MTLRSTVLPASLALFMALTACAPVDILNRLTPSDTFTLTRDHSYGPLESQKLDVYKPVSPKAGAPIIMFIYGGGWNSGTKDIYKFIGEAFSAQGYTTIIPTYRTYPEVIYPDFITDMAQASDWVHSNFDAPVTPIGHSAGAHIASLLALDPRYLSKQNLAACDVFNGWIGLAGPYDFKIYEEPYLSIFPEALRETEILPINYAHLSKLPAMILTGLDDDTVDPAQSARMDQSLRAAASPVSYKTYEGMEHVEIMTRLSKLLRRDTQVFNDVIDFIESLPSQASCVP